MKNKVCKKCHRLKICYGTEKKAAEEFMKMYEQYNNTGIVQLSDEFERECLNSIQIRDGMSVCIRNFEEDKKIRVKTAAAKRAAAQQIMGICGVVEKIADECGTELVFESDIERAVRYKLENIGVFPYEITARKQENGFDIYMRIKSCGGMNLCSGKILRVVSEATGSKMTVKKGLCTMGGGNCSLKFVPRSKVHTEYFSKSVSKSGNTVCGDKYALIKEKDGKR